MFYVESVFGIYLVWVIGVGVYFCGFGDYLGRFVGKNEEDVK